MKLKASIKPPIAYHADKHGGDMIEQPTSFRSWIGLFILSFSLAMIVIDMSIIAISVRSLISDLKTNLGTLQWIISLYSLVAGSLALVGGSMADAFGRKHIFLSGMLIFAAGSYIASLSLSPAMFLVGKAIVQGIGIAFLVPASAAIIIMTFRGVRRAIAFGVWAGIAMAAMAIGPVLAQQLILANGWRFALQLNVIVTTLLILGSIFVTEDNRKSFTIDIDWLGLLLSVAGLAVFIFSLLSAATYGWLIERAPFFIGDMRIFLAGFSIVPIFLALGLVLVFLFILWERRREYRGRKPLLSVRNFGSRQFLAGVATFTFLIASQTGIIFSIPIFLQSVGDLSIMRLGLALLPLSIAFLIASPLSGIITRYAPLKFVVQSGLLVALLGVYVLRDRIFVDVNAVDLIPGLLLYGIGSGIVVAQISNLTLSAASSRYAGEAAGVVWAFRQIGASIGFTIVSIVIFASLTSEMILRIGQSDVIADQVKPVVQREAFIHASFFPFGDIKASSSIPTPISVELEGIIRHSMIKANKDGLFYAGLFIFLALVVSFVLPKTVKKEPLNTETN